MAKRIALQTLNASTIDILNVIRANASLNYQQNIPEVTQATDIPKVGAIIYGTPAFSNEFINALVNRIGLVRVQSATFNNPYERLKKGFLEFGETIEDIFVNIAKVVEYNPEKAEARELKRTLPDVKSVFHTINWKVMYPVTIQDDELKMAFLSMDGVQNLIAKIVDSIYTAAEYDEFLLFKYLMIKAITSGQMHPVSIGGGADLTEAAVQFRGISNALTFMGNKYNSANVKTVTPKSRQIIFMDSFFNAQFDVDVLASAFNMDKANFMGALYLIDDWTTFDNERFEVIRSNSTGLEEVTAEELALLANVKAVMCDEEWFQVYDNNQKFTEKYAASGLYWNYFLHVWKTISSSPFANAVVFATDTADIAIPQNFTATLVSKDTSADAITLAFDTAKDAKNLQPFNVQFVQTEELVTAGIGVHPYGGLLIPISKADENITLEAVINGVTFTGVAFTPSTINVGASVNFQRG